MTMIEPNQPVAVLGTRGGSLNRMALVVLILLTAGATAFGLAVPGAYRGLPPLLHQTWRAQDAVNLALLPILAWVWLRARRGSVAAQIAATGIFTWLAYCYAHLSFATPFTPMFLAYVVILALSAYAALDGLVRMDVDAIETAYVRSRREVAGWFLMVSSLGIAGLWLSDIVLGMVGGTPANLHLAGLPNPTWVLDLGFLIPCAFAAGMKLARNRRGGVMLGGVVLVMLAILSVSMLAVTPFALAAGLASDPLAGPQLVAFSVVFGILGAIEAWLLMSAARHSVTSDVDWIRSSWWPPGR